jgi:hypothetical protein
MNTGGSSSIGSPSNQGSNGKDDSTKKGKVQEDSERFTPPDSSKEGKGVPVSESAGSEARDAEILFRIATHLRQRTGTFQDLQANGTLRIKV